MKIFPPTDASLIDVCKVFSEIQGIFSRSSGYLLLSSVHCIPHTFLLIIRSGKVLSQPVCVRFSRFLEVFSHKSGLI